MKTLIITLLFASFGFANGFDYPDTTKNRNQVEFKEQIKDQKNLNKTEIEGFVDKKGTGEKNRITERKRKDVFIDKDGDGISDTRQGGMSFNKLRKRIGQKQGSGSGSGHNGSR